MEYAIHQFAISLSGTLVWAEIFLALAMVLSRLPVWYAVRRELARDRRGISSWHPEPLPLSAGTRGFRGKSGLL